MKLTTFAFALITVAATAIPMTDSFAGVHTNNLSECLVESTSRQDRLALVNWLYSAASFHPAVRSIASVSKHQLDTANKNSAEMFVRLLTESCKDESEKALKFEGRASIQGSFHALGQVASEELFSDSEVLSAASGLDEYLDKTRLRALVETK
jgi:hypothetical protein